MAPDAEVSTRIRTALAQHLKRDVEKIRPQDDLRKDLGLDSLAMIELLFKIEEAFDLEIPNEDLSQITTVGDVIGYVQRRLGAPASSPAGTPTPVSAEPVDGAKPEAAATPFPAAKRAGGVLPAAAPKPVAAAKRMGGAKPVTAAKPARAGASAKKKGSARA